MLSEKILEQLARHTAFSRPLVEMAWPNLSTESRLNVIQSIQGDSINRGTPAWLARLALDDPAPVVRYWAARYTYFNNSGPAQLRAGFEFLAATDEDRVLYAKAEADPCELVRQCIEQRDALELKDLMSAPHLRRLAFIRNLAIPSLGRFIERLEEGVASGIPDPELRECANEFFMHPRVQDDMKRQPEDFWDGFDAYQCGEGMRRGWALTKTAGPGLRLTLAYALPTSYGLGTMKADELAQLPDAVLDTFIYRTDETKEIGAVVQLMREHPDRFSPAIIEKVRTHDRHDDGARPSAEEIDKSRKLQAVDRHEITLKAVLELQRKVSELQALMEEAATAGANRKRGLFG
jgi:hypothetical protein